jgi:hypothetical protein
MDVPETEEYDVVMGDWVGESAEELEDIMGSDRPTKSSWGTFDMVL